MRWVLKILVVAAIVVVGFWVVLYSYNAILGLGDKGNTVVPDFHAKTMDAAKTLARQAHLAISVERQEYAPDMPKGEILNQDPDAGMQVKKGRPVLVVVSKGPELATVPDVRGYQLEQAEVLLDNARLKPGQADYVQSSVAKKDVVVSQNPNPGASVNQGSSVNLTISSGPPPSITMPNLVGNDLEYVKNVLKANNLKLGQLGWRWDENKAVGIVLTQNPEPGQKLEENSMVSLVISAGPAVSSQDLPFKQSYVTVNLPQFDGMKEVTIWVTDAFSTSEVYDAVHAGGDTIRLMVSSFGDSTIQVKLGNQILSNGKL